MSQKTSAFTLMELSIVLAVVALIAGAVSLGKSLSDASALQSVTADFDRYRAATLMFRDKYKALPGDMINASTVWSANASCPTPAASTTTPIAATCSGDGNGFVGATTGNPLAAQASYIETLLFWQHLTEEQLVDRGYNGRLTTATNGITPTINVPASRIGNAAFSVRYFPNVGTGSGYFNAKYEHVFFLGAFDTSATGYQYPAYMAALSAEDAKAIDTKIDDGKPGLGKVLTPNKTGLSTCATNNVATSATYDASQAAPNCSLIFVTGF